MALTIPSTSILCFLPVSECGMHHVDDICNTLCSHLSLPINHCCKTLMQFAKNLRSEISEDRGQTCVSVKYAHAPIHTHACTGALRKSRGSGRISHVFPIQKEIICEGRLTERVKPPQEDTQGLHQS